MSKRADLKNQSHLNNIIEFLRKRGFVIVYRNNFAVKNNVILFEYEEYEIAINKADQLELGLIIPTKIRLIYGLLITIIASVIASFFINKVFLFGIAFLLIFTYIVDTFYKSSRKATTTKLYKVLNLHLKELNKIEHQADGSTSSIK